MSKIHGIKVFIASSHEFFPSHHPSMSPPTCIRIKWGFCHFDFLASNFASFSFLVVLQAILTSLFSFIRCVIPPCIDGACCIDGVCCIDGSFVAPINWPTLLVSTCIHGLGYEGVVVGSAITIIGCYTHPSGGCHCHYPSMHYCIIGCYIIGYCIISTWIVARWSVCNNFLFLSNFAASSTATTLRASCTNSPSSSSSTWYSNHVIEEN